MPETPETDYSIINITCVWDVPIAAEPADVHLLVRREDIDISIRFDLARGLYWHCVDWHDGMSSERYLIQCTLDYQPGANEYSPGYSPGSCHADEDDEDDEDDAATYIYELLDRNAHIENKVSRTRPEPGHRPSQWTYTNLHLVCLSDEQAKDFNYGGGAYSYLVREPTMPHTAFRTQAGLLRWLEDRGLELSAPLPCRGTHQVQDIRGSYHVMAWCDVEEFAAVAAEADKRIPVLSNGQYTTGAVTIGKGASPWTIHHINCNYPREVLDYQQTRKELDG